MIWNKALIISLVVVLSGLEFTTACQNYGSGGGRLCTYIGSTRSGAVGHGWTCSSDYGTERLIVYQNGRAVYDHCRNGLRGIAELQDARPQQGIQWGKRSAESDSDIQKFPGRIQAALGYAQSATCGGGGDACVDVQAGGQYSRFCSYDHDVYEIRVTIGNYPPQIECN